jgi:hypothetical protein
MHIMASRIPLRKAWPRAQAKMADPDREPQYENPVLALVGRLLPTGEGPDRMAGEPVPPALASIDWTAPKASEPNVARAARRLEAALNEAEWFVTGRIRPELFSEEFVFKDPDVTLKGVRAYALGVHRLFDQSNSRAEIVRVSVRGSSIVDVDWRLSGGVTIGPLALTLKPYIVHTELALDERGLVVYQEDRFSIPSWDILLSALLPALRPFLAPEARPAAELRAELGG